MLERFTKDARSVVVDAQEHGRAVNAQQIEPLHLLIGMSRTHGVAGELLARFGLGADALAAELDRFLRRGGMSDSDAEALGEFGIDVERIVEQIERTHGRGALATGGRAARSGHIRFSREGKKTLELALRQAVDMGDRHIGEEHMLLAILSQPGPAAELLNSRDIGYGDVRRAVEERKAS
jgi:ATP-dependent Clp protease ATP-binding subunit ClpA